MLSLLIATSLSVANGVGFDYPTLLPPPRIAQLAVYGALTPPVLEFESPIQIRLTTAVNQVFWNCVAVYDHTALDVFTGQPPIVRASVDIINTYGNSETRLLCAYYANAVLTGYLMPDAVPIFQELMVSFGLDSSLINLDENVAACHVADAQCLQIAANSAGYTPEIMGSIVAYLAIDVLRNDGWNQDGSLGVDGLPCTANCNPYGDYTGYTPNLNNWKSWQPLTESNGKGFSYNYNHIVPHIGPKAVPTISSRAQIDCRSAPLPKYKYKQETVKVIERLAELSTNDEQKMLVEFFDDKLSVGTAIGVALNSILDLSYEQRVLFTTGFNVAEYEAVITAWNEKRRWDLVRPTTLIKQGIAGDIISTYGGPYAGLQTINAQDFESYIRVMPHSEYPSGSGCICSAIQEFTDSFLENKFNITNSVSVTVPASGVFTAGSSKLEPGSTPNQDISVTFNNMTHLRDICGESRLWGGMHFAASIPAAFQLCDGLGHRTYTYMNALANGDVDTLADLATGNDQCKKTKYAKNSGVENIEDMDDNTLTGEVPDNNTDESNTLIDSNLVNYLLIGFIILSIFVTFMVIVVCWKYRQNHRESSSNDEKIEMYGSFFTTMHENE